MHWDSQIKVFQTSSLKTVLMRTERDYERRRGSASKRGYGWRWQKLREKVLKRQPLCPCGAAATQVDHVIPKRRGGKDSIKNLQGLCGGCHSRKTATEL